MHKKVKRKALLSQIETLKEDLATSESCVEDIEKELSEKTEEINLLRRKVVSLESEVEARRKQFGEMWKQINWQPVIQDEAAIREIW